MLALDVAILPPAAIRDRAREFSEELARARGASGGLILDDTHLPHITLTQQFIVREDLGAAFDAIDQVLRRQPPLALRVIGPGRSSNSAWMSVERTPALVVVHSALMAALRPFERPSGTAAAFLGGDARPDDVAWVTSYRSTSSFDAFTPHITLGQLPDGKGGASELPAVEPLRFDAGDIAACHLGRYCSCRAVLRRWALSEPA
jgi:2'-5' RNA ligase